MGYQGNWSEQNPAVWLHLLCLPCDTLCRVMAEQEDANTMLSPSPQASQHPKAILCKSTVVATGSQVRQGVTVILPSVHKKPQTEVVPERGNSKRKSLQVGTSLTHLRKGKKPRERQLVPGEKEDEEKVG